MEKGFILIQGYSHHDEKVIAVFLTPGVLV